MKVPWKTPLEYGSAVLLGASTRLLYCNGIRNILIRAARNRIMAHLSRIHKIPVGRRKIEEQRILLGLAIVETVDRAVGKRLLDPGIARTSTGLWAQALFIPRGASPAVKFFNQEHGCDPPWFLTISPGHACNLKCEGCYASSGRSDTQLQWSLVDRIVTEAKQLWDIKLIVLSGGEPLVYRSEGKDLLDIVERHPDLLFLMFTNGTLVDSNIASRLAKLGNLTLAFSVEGMSDRTEERRGNGVFNSVVNAMKYIGEAGVPFGISVTVTRDNCEEVLSDQFLEFFFSEQGAFYGFFFQYMPIGHAINMNRMPTPTQRLQFLQKSWDIIRRDKLFLIDFWNHGPLVDGCIAAGRSGGYIYIDWNGKVMPCVFAPYSGGNINDIYAIGGTLNYIWKTPFFKAIRNWQIAYGYGSQELSETANWLRPCPFRDHYSLFRSWLEEYRPEPEDEAARHAASEKDYQLALIKYGDEYKILADKSWKREYVCQDLSMK